MSVFVSLKTWIKDKCNLDLIVKKFVNSRACISYPFWRQPCTSKGTGPSLGGQARNQATGEWVLRQEASSSKVRNEGQWHKASLSSCGDGDKGWPVGRFSSTADREPRSPAPSRWCVCRKKNHSVDLSIQFPKEIWARVVSILFCSFVLWVGSPESQSTWHMGGREVSRLTKGMAL